MLPQLKTIGNDSGFTLIELSIVLVIIGLITGGILLGNDLINAATIRQQISQIEKLRVSTSTFRVKYGYMPGDILSNVATQYGFANGDGSPGQGDGNGLIESCQCKSSNRCEIKSVDKCEANAQPVIVL